MEILAFKIRGKLAHFRKYYANNTAMSFSIPPRTTLMGLIAAAMGWAKDSYYEDLSSSKMQFGVRVLAPLKKRFHRLNLLSIKSVGDLSKELSSDFRGEGGRIQTPFELVSGWNINRDDVVYQIFLSPKEHSDNVFKAIKLKILDGHPVFNIVLGTANFNASIEAPELIAHERIIESTSSDFVEMHSAIPTKLIDDIQFDSNESGRYNFVEEDMMPGDFVQNGNREVRSMNRLLFSTTEHPLNVKVNGSYYRIILQGETINIQFVDS